MQGIKGGRPSSLPSQPLQGVGKGSRLLCFRGRLREGRSLAQSHAAQQGLEPKVRAVTAGLCYTPQVEGESAGEVEGRIRFPLTLDLDKFPTREPSPRFCSITTLGYLIFWSTHCSLATLRLG